MITTTLRMAGHTSDRAPNSHQSQVTLSSRSYPVPSDWSNAIDVIVPKSPMTRTAAMPRPSQTRSGACWLGRSRRRFRQQGNRTAASRCRQEIDLVRRRLPGLGARQRVRQVAHHCTGARRPVLVRRRECAFDGAHETVRQVRPPIRQQATLSALVRQRQLQHRLADDRILARDHVEQEDADAVKIRGWAKRVRRGGPPAPCRQAFPPDRQPSPDPLSRPAPKSIRTMRPPDSRMTLLALMSRWSSPAAWTAASAWHTLMPMTVASSAPIGPCSRTSCEQVPSANQLHPHADFFADLLGAVHGHDVAMANAREHAPFVKRGRRPRVASGSLTTFRAMSRVSVGSHA